MLGVLETSAVVDRDRDDGDDGDRETGTSRGDDARYSVSVYQDPLRGALSGSLQVVWGSPARTPRQEGPGSFVLVFWTSILASVFFPLMWEGT